MLEDAGGILLYSEIVKEMSDVCSESTTNRLLNRLTEKNHVFRVEQDNRVFYRLNDFPVEIKVKLVLLESFGNENPELKEAVQLLKENIVRLYPNLPMENIIKFTMLELHAKYEKDVKHLKLIRKLKGMLEV